MPFRYVSSKNSSIAPPQCCHVLTGLYKTGQRCSFGAAYINDEEPSQAYCGKHYKLLQKGKEDVPLKRRHPASNKASHLRLALEAAEDELALAQADYTGAQHRAESAAAAARALGEKVEALRQQVAELRVQVSQ